MNSLQQIVEYALAQGRNADDCLVIADETDTTHIRWAANSSTTNGSTRTRRLTVIAVTSATAGVVSRSGALDRDAVRELVRAAERAAHQAPPAEDAQPLLTGEAHTSQDWDGPLPQPSIAPLRQFASALGAAFRQARSQQRALYGYAEQQIRTTCLASSTGLRRRHVQPTALLDLTARASHDTSAASAWAGLGGTDLAGIDFAALTARLDTQLRQANRRVDLPPGRYQVLLPPACVADLMLHVYLAAGAKEAIDGRTVFSRPGGGTLAGERLTGTRLTLRSSPHEAGLECAPFSVARASGGSASVFDNGLPLAPTNWISDGVLTALVQTRHSAQLTGLPVTPEIDNLVLEGPPGGRSLPDMVSGTERGLLLTSLWYLRDVDPSTLLLTGLTRDGVYLVEDGEIAGAAHNFRFNESPVRMLDRVIEIGRTERTLPREWGDYFTRMAMPTLRVNDVNMSTVSTAT